MAWRRSMLAAAAAVGLLAACSSSGDDASPATTDITTATTPPAPTTTDAPTTTTTRAATTTDPPPTSLDPAEALAEEVEADLLEALRLGREAAMDPFDTALELAALDRRLGVIRDNLERTLAEYRDSNYALRESEEVAAEVVVEGQPVLLGSTQEVAEVQVCEVNSWILVEVGAGPGGADAVIDPDVVTYRNQFFLRNVDGVWRIEGGNELEALDGVVECGG